MTRCLSMLALLLPLALAAVAAAASPPRPPEPPGQDAAAVGFDRLLRANDVVPDRAALLRAFPDARDRLLQAAGEVARDPWTRQRAVALLSFFEEPLVRAALAELARDPEAAVRSLAVYTLGRTFGQAADAALVTEVARGTEDPVPDVRDHAIRALGWMDHPDAGAVLRRLAGDHVDPLVRRIARRALARRGR